MKIRNKCRQIPFAAVLFLVVTSGFAQTYQVGPESEAQPTAPKDSKSASQPSPAGQDLGWGSNIQNARLARTAEMALQRGDHALAFNYAQRAAQAAPNDAQLWFLLGYAARLDSKLSASADAYQHGLRLKPSSVDGMSGLAQTYLVSGRTGEAERLLRQVVAAAPQRRNEIFLLGDLYVRTGNYESAIEWLDRAERLEPQAQSELLLAVAYQHLKKMDQASHYLEMAKNRAPNNPDVVRALAAFYRDTGEYDKAVDALVSLRNPRPDVVAELAYTYGLAGRPEESARTYAKAADLLPNDLNLQLSAAQAHVGIASFDRAENFLQRAAKLDANYYRLHAIRGAIAQIQDREDDAVREYRAAIEHLPPTPVEGPLYGIQLHLNLIPLYRSINEPDASRRELATAQSLIGALNEQGADRPAFLRLRSLIHSEAGEFDAALTDINESVALRPGDPNSLQLSGDILMKLNRTSEAVAVFQQVLKIDPHSRFALTSLGYASRATGNSAEAERYFNMLAKEYPSSYVPYLALGDMYTDNHDYKRAEEVYARGYGLAPQHPLIVAGGMNAAIESHNLALAGNWQKRVTEKMTTVPQVLREEERYFSFTGDYARSAELGRQAIKLIPRDREVAVYLGYDLLRLEQWDELKALTGNYMNVFPKEADIPLLAGYVDKHNGDLEDAVTHFTEALNRDPKVVTAYTNRGFVYNDLRKPALAAADFEASIKLQPNDPEPHTGLAFAELNLRHPKVAIEQTQIVEKLSGDSLLIHIVRATAYGRLGMLTKSAQEYRAAIKYEPNDGSLYLGLANILVAQRRYREALAELKTAEQHLPNNAFIYAVQARASAELGDREETMRAVQAAERLAEQPVPATITKKNGSQIEEADSASDIYLATGDAISILGDEDAAMERFTKALTLGPKDRVGVRLAIAREMAKQGHKEDAERQIALAQMEVDARDAQPASGEQYIAMAGVLQQVHEYELSQSYLERAKDAGAPDQSVRIAMANSYLALGQTRRAAAELAAVKQIADTELDYQYLLAQASLYQQEHRSAETLSAFAAAASDAGEDPTAEQRLLEAGGNEGYRVNSRLSVLTNLIVQPIFEDSTVYVLDSKLNSPLGPVAEADIANLPTPRSSVESNLLNNFKLHFDKLPTASGFFQVRNAQGTISIPATRSIVQRNTTDYALNFGFNPNLHLGSNVVSFNSGVQGTLRRDTRSPIQINQNLFRVFTYGTTSSFFNAVTVDGFASAEFGKFTNMPISIKIISGALNFRVGTPWGKTALLTGWRTTNQMFDSAQLGNNHNFYTSSYIGLSRKFTNRFSVEAIAENLRTWRSQPFSPIGSAISQALRPAATIHYAPTNNWEVQAASSWELTRGFHTYDMSQNSLIVSYVRGLNRTFNETTGQVHLKYPIRFSAGVRQQFFPNFTRGSNQKIIPFFSLTIF